MNKPNKPAFDFPLTIGQAVYLKHTLEAMEGNDVRFNHTRNIKLQKRLNAFIARNKEIDRPTNKVTNR